MDVCPKCDGKNIEKGIIRGSKNVAFSGKTLVFSKNARKTTE